MSLRRAAGLALLVGAACSDGGPVGPTPETHVLHVAGGDLQFAATGAFLAQPLRVSVRRVTGDVPSDEVTVRWEVVEGAGATLERATSVTVDQTGIATNRLRLGTTPGRYRVRAVTDGAREPAEFEAWAVTTPVLDPLNAVPATGGDILVLTGSNFSAVPFHNVVLFDGIRGRVLSATTNALEVEVPPCLPSRTVGVRVALGDLRTQERPLAVTAAEAPAAVERGAVRDLDASAGAACLRLPQGEYLLVGLSAGTVGGGLYPYGLRGLAPAAMAAPPPTPAGSSHDRSAGMETVGSGAAWEVGLPDLEAGGRWEAGLRRLEAEHLARWGGHRASRETGAGPGAAAAPPLVPEVGDKRTFEVLNGKGSFESIRAVVRHVGARAVLYVDERAPAAGLSNDDLAALSDLFDQVIHPVVTDAYGGASDLDGNERVVMLFTPVVNGLTSSDAEGFVGGFFFGLDLLPEREHSNGGEIFYTLVPDPEGRFGRKIQRTMVMESVPAVLAHELQHMVHFNQRVLLGGATSADALWLSEGMAHMAEDLVGDALAAGGPQAGLFLRPNETRGRRFLARPQDVSLIIAQGQGSLAERGAGWLFVRYLDEQLGREVLGRLSRSSDTGVKNVGAVAGRDWNGLLADWLTALYTDGLPAGKEALHFPVIDLRTRLSLAANGYPLNPEILQSGDFLRVGSLYSSSGAYLRLLVGSGGMAVALGDEWGGPPPETARFQLRIVRLE